MKTNKSFIELTQDIPHKPILEKALSCLDSLPLVAIDCGCGAGNESAFLLNRGFLVHAFDPSIEAATVCSAKFRQDEKFILSTATFEKFNFPKASLIIALLSLIFCDPESLEDVLDKIIHALPKGGVFLADLLGKEDAWLGSHPEKFIGFDKQQIQSMFSKNFDFLFFNEIKGERRLANGTSKFWHVYTLILKKI